MISRGTEWRRWEPHIHGPGTLLNDQFKGADAWKNYIQALEDCTPTIEALAVTDCVGTLTACVFSALHMQLDAAP